MELTSFVERLRRELAVAAEAGGEEARELAERLTAPLDSAVRLTLLEALSTAATEITRDLAPGSVDVRLRGRNPEFVVTPPQTDHESDSPPPDDQHESAATTEHADQTGPPTVDEGPTARINFRPPEHLKARIEEAAGRERLSVNAWLVRATAKALETQTAGQRATRRGPVGDRYTGWVR